MGEIIRWSSKRGFSRGGCIFIILFENTSFFAGNFFLLVKSFFSLYSLRSLFIIEGDIRLGVTNIFDLGGGQNLGEHGAGQWDFRFLKNVLAPLFLYQK